MKYQLTGVIAAVAMLTVSAVNGASPYDGKTNLLCTVQELYECASQAGCQEALAQDMARIRHLVFDFKAGAVKKPEKEATANSSIKSVEVIDNLLIVQGWDAGFPEVEDGGGWSMSVNRTYGTMTAAISGHDVGFVGLGSCIAGGK